MKTIPTQYLDLFQDETRAHAFLATLMKDGSPQVTPVWFDTDGEYIFVNSAAGRIKDRNMRQRRQVALAIQDPKNPGRYIQIRGEVVEATTEGADEHADRLAGKYTGVAKYTIRQPGEQRVRYKIRPDHVTGMG